MNRIDFIKAAFLSIFVGGSAFNSFKKKRKVVMKGRYHTIFLEEIQSVETCGKNYPLFPS